MWTSYPFYLIQQPRASAPHECWSETGVTRGHLEETQGLVKTRSIAHPVVSWDLDTRGYYQGVDTPGGFAGLALP